MKIAHGFGIMFAAVDATQEAENTKPPNLQEKYGMGGLKCEKENRASNNRQTLSYGRLWLAVL